MRIFYSLASGYCIVSFVMALLEIKNLCVDFKTPSGIFRAVDNVSFSADKGETVAIVGESGSGKSVTALSIMQLLPYPMASHSDNSSILFEDNELVGADRNLIRSIRGRKIGMIFQEPLSSLNPLHAIGQQIAEPLEVHKKLGKKEAVRRVKELLDLVGLPMLKTRLNAYPHELSGGQRQRVMIAMALANDPDILIADEPTTALDVTVQAQILELLKDIQKRLGMTVLLITHDLSIVEKMADRICVMQGGKLVEQNTSKKLFSEPRHDYTKMLLDARPKGKAPKVAGEAKSVLEANKVKVWFPKKKSITGKPLDWVKAVDEIDVSVKAGRTLGVVGESGSGKSTLGLALLRLVSSNGNIRFGDTDISSYGRKEMCSLRSRMQVVFQDPYGSLSPRMTVGEIIGEGLKIHNPQMQKNERDEITVEALGNVHMDPETRHRYPHEFSGGQRQRISIARAMVLNPEFVVLDEPTSALDVSVQAQIVDLLREIQEEHTIAYMFISHDLRVVRAMAHDLIVMKDGKVVEAGSAEEIFTNPKQEYTRTLMDAALNLKVRA